RPAATGRQPKPGRTMMRDDDLSGPAGQYCEQDPVLPDAIWNNSTPDPCDPYQDVAVRLAQDARRGDVTWRPAEEAGLAVVGEGQYGRAMVVRTVITDLAARGWREWIV